MKIWSSPFYFPCFNLVKAFFFYRFYFIPSVFAWIILVWDKKKKILISMKKIKLKRWGEVRNLMGRKKSDGLSRIFFQNPVGNPLKVFNRESWLRPVPEKPIDINFMVWKGNFGPWRQVWPMVIEMATAVTLVGISFTRSDQTLEGGGEKKISI